MIIFLTIGYTCVLGAQKNHLIEKVLLSTTNYLLNKKKEKYFLITDSYLETRLRGYKTFFMLNPTEHGIYLAHKC